jgi:lipoate-protein ligase A
MCWEVQRACGTVAELHQRSLALIASAADERFGQRRIAVVQSPMDSALVLGSAQPESSVDLDACAKAGIALVRRRSGGGAVLVEPGSLVWIDLVIAATDPLWSPDIGRSTWWVGAVWTDALRSAGLGALEVWKGPMVRNEWSSWVCFAGLGPGEVVTAQRRKVVGISQRRTRHAALFQCACLVSWEPETLLGLLAWPGKQLASTRRGLASAATGVGTERAGSVVQDLVTHLP